MYFSDVFLNLGLTADIPANSDVGVSVSIGNPPVAGTTAQFSMAIVKKGTNVYLAWVKGIKGVTIGPGEMSKVLLQKLNSEVIIIKDSL
jgi:hypothetical protein